MTKKAFSFEQAIEELQTIVTAMEAGNVSLDESLGLYERGVELVRLCNQRFYDDGSGLRNCRDQARRRQGRGY